MDKIHFAECHSLQNKSYPTFRMKLVNMFENPNMSQALMAEWADVRQLDCEDLTTFMTRFQDLVEGAFLGYSDAQKQHLLFRPSAVACRISIWQN